MNDNIYFYYQPPPVADGGTKLDVEELSARLFDIGDICSWSGEGVARWWWCRCAKNPLVNGWYGGGLNGCCLIVDEFWFGDAVDRRSKFVNEFPGADIVNIFIDWRSS